MKLLFELELGTDEQGMLVVDGHNDTEARFDVRVDVVALRGGLVKVVCTVEAVLEGERRIVDGREAALITEARKEPS